MGMYKTILFSIFALLSVAISQEKTIAIVSQAGVATPEIRRDLVEDCIQSLPSAETLNPVTEAKELFLKHRKGVNGDNGHTKVWTARIRLGYLVRQKHLYVASSGGVQAQPVQFREALSSFQTEELIESHPGDSDFMAGANPRTYYFISSEQAAASARKRAQQRLTELRGRLCPAQ